MTERFGSQQGEATTQRGVPRVTSHDLAKLRARCERRLRQLVLPVPFSVERFAEELAKQRGRPIVIRPVATRDPMFGLTFATPAADFVVYQQDTSPMHAEHIVMHELSHLVCGHQTPCLSAEEVAQAFATQLPLRSIVQALRRSVYSTEEDCEAELMATLILEHRIHAAPDVPMNPDDASLNERLETALASPRESAS